MSLVTTRAQKRRIGERNLWSLIVKCDDICFTHVLPRLSATDIKFLYGVNKETRALVKRSTRAGDLKKKFNFGEMSSISTLEVARENKSSWTNYWTDEEKSFCWRVAETNKLELLKWIREEKECEWCAGTITAAAAQGNLEMVKYCVANECPIDVWACAHAAHSGHLECLKYLREEVKAPWDESSVFWAHMNDHPECVQYLLDNNCPLPFGWRYEDGEVYIPRGWRDEDGEVYSESESESESEE